MSYEFYSVEKKGHIAWVWLNRPDKKNGMNPRHGQKQFPFSRNSMKMMKYAS